MSPNYHGLSSSVTWPQPHWIFIGVRVRGLKKPSIMWHHKMLCRTLSILVLKIIKVWFSLQVKKKKGPTYWNFLAFQFTMHDFIFTVMYVYKTIVLSHLIWCQERENYLLNGTLGLEEYASPQQLSKDAAHRPDINGVGVMAASHQDLRSTVVLCHHFLSHVTRLVWLLHSGQAKITDLGDSHWNVSTNVVM